jgi:hypothetical protein
MTDQTAMVNRALQTFGSRTTVTAAQLANNGSNEAIQANLIYVPFRRRLLRMAPWACGFNTLSLNYITSVYGTPENVTAAQTIWTKGQPAPPWAYAYQYPIDCIRACWVTPQTATGFASGIPITTAVTGGAPTFWQGPPVKYSVAQDQFYNVTAATPSAPGSGYAVGDIIVLVLQPNTSIVTNALNPSPGSVIGTLAQAPGFPVGQPQGAPPILQVTGIGGGGSVTSVAPYPATRGEDTPYTGSLYYQYATQPVAQNYTTGSGTGATFNLTYGGPSDQRVILTNQEFAILNYVRDVTDENIFDDDFQEAFALIIGARLCQALTGDKQLANLKIAEANAMITEARGTDANEGLKVNDVTPDWLRIRGIDYVEDYSGPYNTGFNWGAIWPGYT